MRRAAPVPSRAVHGGLGVPAVEPRARPRQSIDNGGLALPGFEERCRRCAGAASKGRTLVMLVAGKFIANVDTSIANIATPSILARLGASGAEPQPTVSGYILASAVL